MDTNKGRYEEFASFFENPTRDRLRELLRHNTGESPNCDFKEQWPSFSALARHLLGLGNSDGGCIIIGVVEAEDHSFDPGGLDTLVDKADFTNGVKKFLPGSLLSKIHMLDFAFEAAEYPKLVGKKFQVVLVEHDPKHLPFVAASGGDGIRNNAIYIRRGASTEEANYEELQSVINKRIETGHSSSKEITLYMHLGQLESLMRSLSNRYEELVNSDTDELLVLIGPEHYNEVFYDSTPGTDDDEMVIFLKDVIEKKKKQIEVELGVKVQYD